MKLKVPNENYSIVGLYDTVAQIMGRETKDVNYDCRNINVAPNIQDGFFEHYLDENRDIPESDFNAGMAMLLACYGPKVDKTLEYNEVEVFDGFIC